MIVDRVFTPGLAQVAYLVADEDAGVAAVIDPRRDVDAYLSNGRRIAVSRSPRSWKPTSTPTSSPVPANSRPPPARRSTPAGWAIRSFRIAPSTTAT